MMLERTYLPATQFIGLSYDEVSTRALYEVMEQEYHQTIRLAQEDFSASIARSDAAIYLDILEGSAILKLVRTTLMRRTYPLNLPVALPVLINSNTALLISEAKQKSG